MYYNCVTQTCDENNMSQSELMNKVQSLAFAVNDLTLYLDTHPNCQKAIDLHNQYANEYKKCYDAYERKYGPLSIYCPTDKFTWGKNPWPWEGEN